MTKKIMIPIFVAALMLTFTSAGWAAVNTLSFNVSSGDAKYGDHSYDLRQYVFGLTVPLNNKVEFNGELYKGENDGYGDTTTFKLKGDYRIFQNKTTRLDVSGGYYRRNEDADDYTISSLMVGVDGRVMLNNKLSVYSGLSIGLLPKEEWDHGEGDPDSLFLFHMKFNYMLNSQWGVSAGYFSESFDSGWKDIRYNGLTAGMFFRF
jgi:hypothetical protein